MADKPRILVIGEQGQIAWELARTLATLGQVICAGRGTPEHAVDLASPDSIRSLVSGLQPHWIINAAAYTAVDRAEEEEALAMRINGEAPGILAEEAARLGATFVHYSTDYVFDGTSDTPYLESSPVNPQSAYGRSKLVGEQAVSAVDGNYYILRTSWVYGSRGHNFYRTMRRLMAEREELAVVADQLGAPTWSRSIAEATAQLIAKLGCSEAAAWANRGIYHVSAAGATSWHGFASAILEGMLAQGLPVKTRRIRAITTEEYPLPARRPHYSVLGGSRLQDAFQIHMPDWRDALAQVQRECTD